MVERRRFLIDPAQAGETVALGAYESRHALRALRLRTGQKVEAVDGSGWEYLLELTGAASGKARARVLERRRAARGWPLEVIVAAGIVKGARMDWAVEKAAELGARAFIPFVSERSMAQPEPDCAKVQRWKRLARSALKQSLGPYLMRVGSPKDLAYVARLASRVTLALLTDPEGPPLAALPALARPRPACLLIVGPEGGLSEREVAQLSGAGALRFSLGPRRLRSETAVAAGLAALWVASRAGGGDGKA